MSVYCTGICYFSFLHSDIEVISFLVIQFQEVILTLQAQSSQIDGI